MANSSLSRIVDPATEPTSGQDSGGEIRALVASLVKSSSTREEFLQRLADRLRQLLQADLVAIAGNEVSPSRFLMSGVQRSGKYDQATMVALLETAGSMPIACDVPLSAAAAEEPTGRIDAVTLARGLRVELTPAPDRTAALVLYPPPQRPSMTTRASTLLRASCQVDA